MESAVVLCLHAESRAMGKDNIESLSLLLTTTKDELLKLQKEHTDLLDNIQANEGSSTALQQLNQMNGSAHQTWGAAQQVVMKGLYEEGTQDVVTQVFIQDFNSTPWLVRLHNCILKETPSPFPQVTTSQSLQTALNGPRKEEPTAREQTALMGVNPKPE
uniref:Uncharacterized protein n=1 Tax=Timema poppense TaxID=170557 RepID=A0A7R9HB03_TIMPO|nr:unnamed protein product [Timema poppensis]